MEPVPLFAKQKATKQKAAKEKIRIRMKSFSHRDLDATAKEIAVTVRRTGGEVRGPIPLPTRTEHFTVNRSPHVDKKSREQFQIKTHKRMLDIIDPTEGTVDALMRLDLAASVQIDVRMLPSDRAELQAA